MANKPNRLKVTELDFDSIKLNLKNFLKQQSEFEDYDFEGSGINILLDILAYNTHYNSYYLNMIANESFLDSSILRNSVVSHAKKYGYVPKSRVAPKAKINITVNSGNFANNTLILPKNYGFVSEVIDPASGISYDFVTLEERIAEKIANTFTFSNVEIYQGKFTTFSFDVYDEQTNPKQIFEIPDPNIDTNTLKVSVQQSSSNTYTTVFNRADNILQITGNSNVYYLQEGQNGNYQIYFGDGVLGRKITDGSIVNIQYLITDGTVANKANNFTVTESISGLSSITINSISSASGGSEKESIDEIKYSAPLKFLAQNRAVTKNDYIKLIKEKYEGFDDVNVWGGEENDPPVFGKVFVSGKPKLGFELSNTEKDYIKEEVLKPISILTVTPDLVDVDYNYVKLDSKVYYNPTLTNLTENDLKSGITSLINTFCNDNLNKFDSYLKTSLLLRKIDDYNQSIVSNELDVFVGKKFRPDFTTSRNYILDFGMPLKRGEKETNFSSSPEFSLRVVEGTSVVVRDTCSFEEVPSSYSGIESITVTNPGYDYTRTPTVKIIGDGEGATAVATLLNGRISKITVTNRGVGYTSAAIVIENDERDTTGRLAEAKAVTEGRYGNIRIVYYAKTSQTNFQTVKYIVNANVNDGIVGEIDYELGKITINNFAPIKVDNDFGSLSLFIRPKSNIIKSNFNKMLVIDSTDSSSIAVKIIKN